MAKQTKSQKKQSGKIKRTIGWFKPTTRLKGMLLFSLVFASIGGGILIYNSYAYTYTRSFPANTMQSVSKGHCRMQYTGGNYLGVAYVKTRIRSDIAGRRCWGSVIVWATNGSTAGTTTPEWTSTWSSTSWSGWSSAHVGPIAYFKRGDLAIENVETGNVDHYLFTIY